MRTTNKNGMFKIVYYFEDHRQEFRYFDALPVCFVDISDCLMKNDNLQIIDVFLPNKDILYSLKCKKYKY